VDLAVLAVVLDFSSISTQQCSGRAFSTDMEDVTNSNTVDEVKTQLSGPTSRKFPSKPPFMSSKRNIEQSTQGRLPTIEDTSSTSSDTGDDDNNDHSNQTAQLTHKRKRFPTSKRHIRLTNTTLKQHTDENACSAKQRKLAAGGRLLANRPSALNPYSAPLYGGYDAKNCYSNHSSDDLSDYNSEDHSRYMKSNKQPISTVRPYRLRNQRRKCNHSTADKDEEYEVENILNARLSRGKLQYCVKWLGYKDDQTWYDASNFKNSPYKLRDFHLADTTRPGPPKRLGRWIECWEEDRDADDHPDDNKL
jgi:hypothetical protein